MKLCSKNECTGCMACVDSCKHNALHSYYGKDGHLYVKADMDKCIECKACEKACPIISKFQYENKNSKALPFAAWANGDELRLKSTSGGVFAAVATFFVNQGGYVVGAVNDGYNVRSLISNRLEDISLMQGSKYQQGDLTGIYNKIKELLKGGEKILFSGTACQIVALKSSLGKQEYIGQLFTLDLICGGFPSSLLMKSIQQYNEGNNLFDISYRDKKAGWRNKHILTIKISKGVNIEEDTSVSSFFYLAFGSHFTHRMSCLDCPFAFAERKSDLTIADFWGNKTHPKEHEKGLSVVVAHTNEGLSLLEASNLSFEKVSWNDFLVDNQRMVIGKSQSGKREIIHSLILSYLRILIKCNISPVVLNRVGKTRFIYYPLRYAAGVYRKWRTVFYTNTDEKTAQFIADIEDKKKRNENS